jgi:predicted dehydrogenase
MALRVAFLGYRFMARAHANALARLPMFFPDSPATERHTLIGRDEAALADAADRLGFTHTATDWKPALDEVDVLYNLGPNHVHPEPSIAALESGVHVLCEKPLAPTLSDAERMATAAAESDVLAGCAFNYRFLPAIQYARRLIEHGALGEIRHFRGSYLQDWLLDPETPWSWRNAAELAGSGALGDLGAHTIDLARFLVGDRAGGIERVSGHLETFVGERPVESDGGDGEDDGGNGSGGDGDDTDGTRPVTVDDAYSAQFAFGNGAMGTVAASRFAAGHENDHTIAVHGSEGSLRFSLERPNELEVLCGDGRGYETVLVTDPEDPYVDRWWPPGHVLGWEHAFVHEDYEFLSAVGGGEPFSPSFADGLAVQRVLDAIERSDERGEWVALS